MFEKHLKHHGFGRERSFERGALRLAMLSVIKDRPRHGYDVIKGIEEKFHGFYMPSAGSVYPILQLLEDQQFIIAKQEDGRKVYGITAAGGKELEENKERLVHMEERMRHRFGGVSGERLHGLMDEIRQTAHFILRKAEGGALKDPETMKKIRIAFAGFRSEIENILQNEQDTG